jgi:hypothetical protein
VPNVSHIPGKALFKLNFVRIEFYVDLELVTFGINLQSGKVLDSFVGKVVFECFLLNIIAQVHHIVAKGVDGTHKTGSIGSEKSFFLGGETPAVEETDPQLPIFDPVY